MSKARQNLRKRLAQNAKASLAESSVNGASERLVQIDDEGTRLMMRRRFKAQGRRIA